MFAPIRHFNAAVAGLALASRVTHRRAQRPRPLRPRQLLFESLEGRALLTAEVSVHAVNLYNGEGYVPIQVNLSEESEDVVAVDFSLTGITATPGDDFYLLGAPGVFSGNISFAAHETQHEFNVYCVDDALIEGDESFRITLSNPVNATLSATEYTDVGVIADNDFLNPADDSYPMGSADTITVSAFDGVRANDDRSESLQDEPVSLLTDGQYGSVVLNPNGSFTYTRDTSLNPPTDHDEFFYKYPNVNTDPPKTAKVSIVLPLEILTIYDGQNGAAVSDAEEATVGAFTVANQNDTDGDGFLDSSLEDWIVNGGTAGPQGEDEKDLMKLVVQNPPGYTPGTSVTLTLSSPDSMRLWAESTRQNVVLDGGNSIGLEFGAQEATKTLWVELKDPSGSVADYKIEATYNGRGDIVAATAVWAEKFAHESRTRTAAAVLAEAPWSNMGSVLPAVLSQIYKGTGVRPIDDNYGIVNVIYQAWKPTPDGILSVSRVKFDITRRAERTRWDRTDASFTQVNHKDMPVKLDAVNDDDPPIVTGQDEDGPFGGLFFVFDGPGFGSVPAAPVIEMAQRFNFEEFMRVRFDSVTPSASDPNQGAIDGTRASFKFLWHSRDQVKKNDTVWQRVAAYDEIGENNDYNSTPNPS